MKKKAILISVLVVVVSLLVMVYLSSDNSVKAEVGKMDKAAVDKLLRELRDEQALVEKEKQRLAQLQQNLKSFEDELDKRNNEYLRKSKELAAKEEAFQTKLEGRMVDRQVIETYESIDPEQAAILMKNLYGKDQELATLVMRKIAGKKAGKI
ncbi:MAG: hypothetical protein GY950_22925, partial [bacterium]|nr:hypothetical protein [bacterium]